MGKGGGGVRAEGKRSEREGGIGRVRSFATRPVWRRRLPTAGVPPPDRPVDGAHQGSLSLG